MAALNLNPTLNSASHLTRWTRPQANVQLTEWGVMFGCGMLAAIASTFLNFHLRIPGHAILKVTLPIAAGLALVPRQGAGSVMGTSALLTAFSLRSLGYGGEGLGFGALTSMAVLGPSLDFMLQRIRTHRGIYVAMIIGGLSANIAALIVRGTFKGLGWEKLGSRPLGTWLAQASITYLLCGIAAGIISALILFDFRASAQKKNAPQTESPE